MNPFTAIIVSFFGTILISIGLISVIYVMVGQQDVSAGYGFWTMIATFILCFVVVNAAGMK